MINKHIHTDTEKVIRSDKHPCIKSVRNPRNTLKHYRNKN